MARQKPKREETWQEQLEREAREAREALTRVLPLLRRLGVKTVTVAYDGSGDEGFIESVDYQPMPTAGIPEGLNTLIENAVECQIPAGWENNEGSSGIVTLIVETGKLLREHSWRVMTTETEESELDL